MTAYPPDALRDAALDREIEMALAVDPSPAFKARVRTRITNEPMPSSPVIAWMLAAAAVAAVLAIVALSPELRVASSSVPVLASRPILGASLIVPVPPALVWAELATSRPSDRGRGSSATTSIAGSTIVFDTREVSAIQLLIAGVRDGRIDPTTLPKETPPAPMELQPIADIVIAPITIEPLAPEAGTEGERQ